MVGVSGDNASAQLKFVEKYGLTYPMVPNPDKDILASYGTRALLGMAKRSTFLIDPEGRIAHVWPGVKLGGHGDDVVATIRRLSA